MFQFMERDCVRGGLTDSPPLLYYAETSDKREHNSTNDEPRCNLTITPTPSLQQA
jgi:hypothetical protein